MSRMVSFNPNTVSVVTHRIVANKDAIHSIMSQYGSFTIMSARNLKLTGYVSNDRAYFYHAEKHRTKSGSHWNVRVFGVDISKISHGEQIKDTFRVVIG